MARPPMYITDLNDSVKVFVAEFARWNKNNFKNGPPIELLEAITEMDKESIEFLKKRRIR